MSVGGVDIEPDYTKFKWSVDGGKTWFPCETEVVLKAGAYTVQWGSDSDVWAEPKTKAKINLTAGESYSNEGNPAYFTFVYAISASAVQYLGGGEWTENDAAGTVTMNPADGRFASSVPTLTAKASKGYAFVGWQLENDREDAGLAIVSTAAKVSGTIFTYDESALDVNDFKFHVNAVFRRISDYTDEAMDGVFGTVYTSSDSYEVEYTENGPCVTVPARVGCAAYVFVIDGCDADTYPLTMKVAGNVPKELKVTDCGYLYGTPTKAGTYDFSVTVADPAGHARTLAVTLEVGGLPEDVVGTFGAMLYESSEDGVRPAGLLDVAISATGKTSAKITTAAGVTSVTPTLNWRSDGDSEGEGTYALDWVKVTSKSTSYAYFSLNAERDPENGLWNVSYTEYAYDSKGYDELELSGTMSPVDRSLLSDDGFKGMFLGKYHTAELSASESDAAGARCRTPSELMASGYLTLAVDKKGTVKFAGKLPDGEKLSGSANLLPYSVDSAGALLFVTPSSYKKRGSFALELNFTEDGVVGSGSWVTPPLLDCPSDGIDLDEADDAFKPGLLSVTANGCVYSALSDLTDYYLALSIAQADVAPTYEYTYADSDKVKVQGIAEMVSLSYCLSSDDEMLKGGKGGKVTVGKSASPWKDSDGYYNYDVTKPDKYGETQTILNPGSISLSFKSATGIFSGKFNVFFDYDVPQYKNGEEIGSKREHKTIGVSYEGVVISRDGETGYGVGSAQYVGKQTFSYTSTDKKGNEKISTKSYTQTVAMPVTWNLLAP